MSVGSFSNDDGDGNENVKKAIGLDWKNKNIVRASRIFAHFFVVTARLRRENASFTFYGGRKQGTTNFSFSF